jgi:hypothetical protein
MSDLPYGCCICPWRTCCIVVDNLEPLLVATNMHGCPHLQWIKCLAVDVPCQSPNLETLVIRYD